MIPISLHHRFSRRLFSVAIAVILSGFLAFPIYQATQTGGVLFYINGIDESSYLSYPFSSYAISAFSGGRVSSFLVLALHQLGLSGGYCNVLFDTFSTITILLGLVRLLGLLGYDRDDARRGALLIFLLPLVFGSFNPVFYALSELSLSGLLSGWIVTPFNPELPFARSPEPQLSFLLIVIWLNIFVRTRLLIPAAFVLAPLLYSFVRVPFLFAVIASIPGLRVRLRHRLLCAWVLIGVIVTAFLWVSNSQHIEWLSVRSRLPIISVMGLCALVFYASLRNRAPAWLLAPLPILVASTWIGQNTQVISGVLAAPAHYEQYWSITVVGFLAAITIISFSQMKNLWIMLALSVFIAQSAQSFSLNLGVSRKLFHPKEALAAVKKAAESVAVDDLYLASFLDLAYPNQPATLFSFNRTYDTTSDASYHRYLCGRHHIEQNDPDRARSFAEVFNRLDYGYQVRGIDQMITAGRGQIKRRELSPPDCARDFTDSEPIVSPLN